MILEGKTRKNYSNRKAGDQGGKLNVDKTTKSVYNKFKFNSV